MELSEAKKIAKDLMRQHLTYNCFIEWRFRFDSSKRRFGGGCNYTRKIISLSKSLVILNDIKEIKNTILHEIAHILTPRQGHNHIWKQKAIEIGCDGKACYSLEEVKVPKGRYMAICPNGHIHNRFNAPRINRQSCGKCSRKFNPNYILNRKKVEE